MRGHVGTGKKIRAVAPQIHGFVAESRERGEAAQHADENQGARFSREDAARLDQLRKKADGQTTDEIYRQRAVGKVYAARPVLNEAGYSVTEGRSDEAADARQK